MPRIIASLLIFAAFIVAPLASSAAPITVPTDLSVGDKYRLAFVTSTLRDATDVLIGPYNDFVAAVAGGQPELAALGTTWRAIGSTETVDARDNTGTNPLVSTGVPIYMLDDTRLADDNADLYDGIIAAPFSVLESGFGAGNQFVWTGSAGDGTGQVNAELGTIALGPFSHVGTTTDIGHQWIARSSRANTNLHPMFAMSGVLTVIPEPSTMILFCIGATALVGWQLRRRRHRKS